MNQWLTGWKEADYPRVKKKGRSGDSFRLPQGFGIDQTNSRIKLPKLGWIKYRNSWGVGGSRQTECGEDVNRSR